MCPIVLRRYERKVIPKQAAQAANSLSSTPETKKVREAGDCDRLLAVNLQKNGSKNDCRKAESSKARSEATFNSFGVGDVPLGVVSGRSGV